MSKKTIYWLIAIAVIVVIGWLLVDANSQPGEYDQFAQCLDEQEAIFYGAFWCPHCQNQKEMFGKSAKYLPYIECSTPDGQGQKRVCDEVGVESYPTWVFADESRLTGEVELDTLAEKTGCQLPNNTN